MYEKLKHTTWECKYHVVFIPKFRRKAIFGQLRPRLGEIFKDLVSQREVKIVEGHLMQDHVHMLLLIPPKHSVSKVVGFPEGEKCHCDSKIVWQEKKFCWTKFLGKGVFCDDGGQGRGSDKGLYQKPRKRRTSD